ncbi:Tetratricopeptide repeat protein 38 (TPR repeat protein 38)-like protein [Sarcoptes scabiei]|uniref:Tetratricopeptide repeat protein 38 n=1 Tax=Sarcoptes scabiei TaxID=52283 RepID=A0A132A2V9_SARSC|nr:Tetratricopeptide repeat protein 38 (TPR repeat protein 38)-like protein [Sarcoptes scabiei]
MFPSSWFSLKEWEDIGLKINSTSSNEAVKLYDSALTQFTFWADDPSQGGLIDTLDRLEKADTDFVLGKTLSLGLKLLDHTKCYFLDSDILNETDSLEKLMQRRENEISFRERKHVEAVGKLSRLDLLGAANVWEQILQQYPNDIHALKFCFYSYLFHGEKQKQFDLIQKSYPYFFDQQKITNHYSMIMNGMLSFVNEELQFFRVAERYGRQGLERNPFDGWATHALAHVMEMEGRFEEGINFMNMTERNWTKSNHLACHNYWHLSLFNLSTDNFDAALDLFDEKILPTARQTKKSFNLCDAASLLYRTYLLKYDDPDRLHLQSRFEDVFAIVKPYLNHHVIGFCDLHYLMACIGSKHSVEAKNLFETIGGSDLSIVQEESARITQNLMESMILFDAKRYEEVIKILLSIKDSIVSIGGSDAQRDIFNQLLIVSAMQSKQASNNQDFIDRLNEERKIFKKNDRFIQQKQFQQKLLMNTQQ